MQPKDITPASIEAYLKEKGFTPSQIFGKETERIDPIDRHIILRAMYEKFVDYRMESHGLTTTDQDDHNLKIVHPNMKNFDEIVTINDCVTNLKFLAYRQQAKQIQKGNTEISLSDLKHYFENQHDKSLDDLFGDTSYYRYTREGNDILEAGIEHYTGWKMGKKGLTLHDPKHDPLVHLHHPEIQKMQDLKTVELYLSKINQLRKDRKKHFEIIQEGKSKIFDQGKEQTLKNQISEFLSKDGWDIDMLTDQKRSLKQRSEKMNAVLRTFSKTYINEEQNVVIMNPIGETHQVTKDRGFTFSKIEDTDHFLRIVRGFKQNRDLSFYIASPFVEHGEEITHEKAQYIAQEKLGFSLSSIIEGKEMTVSERNGQLDSLHFYLSEAHQDSDFDLVISHPNDEKNFVLIKEIENKEDYYTSIRTVDDFMDKVKHARNRRDMLHNALNRIHELGKKDQEFLRDVLKIEGDNEQER